MFTKVNAHLIDRPTCMSRDNARVLRPVLRGTKGANPLRLLDQNALCNRCNWMNSPLLRLLTKTLLLIFRLAAVVVSDRQQKSRWRAQMILAMKLSFILLTTAMVSVHASGLSQKITLAVKQAPLQQVFQQVEKKTNYVFFFKKEDLADARPVSIEAYDLAIEAFMEKLLVHQPLKFFIEDNAIIISRKNNPVQTPNKNLDKLIESPTPITGIVRGPDGKPLSGATIRIKGRNATAVTDENGAFQLEAEKGNVLIISYIGFSEKLVKIERGDPLSIWLQRAVSSLDTAEVVLSTGYQYIPKERATGSFAHIGNKLLNRRVSTDIISRLEDVTSGLLFDRRGSGQPKLDIRGRSTIFANDQPLIVVDNFPYEGDLNSINPNDIAHITVLKDAGAASIWGARAGNGVIVITTKKPAYSQKMRVAFNSNLNVAERPRLHDLPWISSADYIDLEQDLFERGYYVADENSVNKPPISPVVEMLIAVRDGKMDRQELDRQLALLKTYDVRNDMRNLLYRNRIDQQYALSVDGGSDKMRFLVSAGYDHNRPQEINNRYSRASLRSAVFMKPLPKLEVGAGFNYSGSVDQSNNSGYTAVNIGNARGIYPYARLADDEGKPLAIVHQHRTAFLNEAAASGLKDWSFVPLNDIYERDYTTQLHDLRLTADLRYNLTGWLNAEVKYQYQRVTREINYINSQHSYMVRNLVNSYTQFNANGSFSHPVPDGAIADRGMRTISAHSLRSQLNINKSWNRMSFTGLAGMEFREVSTEGYSNRYYGFNEDILTVNTIVDYNTYYRMYPTANQQRIPNPSGVSGLFDVNISYNANGAFTYLDRYTISFGSRIDQSNLFGVKTNQKSVPLWSAGVSWNLDKEQFYQLHWLPQLKLRATYGFNGNIDRTVTAFTTARYVNGASYTGLPYAIVSNPPNAELRWEKIGILNIGADFGFIGNRISGAIEYFNKTGRDLMGFSPLDPTTGMSEIKGNVASMRGSGWDLTLNSLNINRRFKWNSTLLLSRAVDKVTSYEPEQTSAINYVSDASINRFGMNPVVGRPVFGLYSFRWAGLDGQNGNPLGYLPDGTVSGDYGKILASTSVNDLVFHGYTRPPVYGSLRNTFTFNNLSLSFNISFKFGHWFRAPSVSYNALYTNWNGHKDFANRWRKPGDEAFTHVPSMPYPANQSRDNFYNATEVLADRADLIRFQDLGLNYVIDKKLWQNNPFSNLEVYMYANNPGLIWKANSFDVDPDFLAMRPSRSIAFGLRASF
jgi:TonB-linked outer membrane protein, SusC/RagA family